VQLTQSNCGVGQNRNTYCWVDSAGTTSAALVVRRGGRVPRWTAILVSAGVMLTQACSLEPELVVHTGGSANVPAAELASVLSTSREMVQSIDQGERRVYSAVRDAPSAYLSIELDPGTYEILIRYYTGENGPSVTRQFQVSLLAGHRYRPGANSCPWREKHGCSISCFIGFVCDGYAGFVWIEDDTSGQVVAGSKTVPAIVQ
jgi:hypothetical protein